MEDTFSTKEINTCKQWYEQNKIDHHFLSDMLDYLRQHNTEAVEQMIEDWMNELEEKIETYEKENENEDEQP